MRVIDTMDCIGELRTRLNFLPFSTTDAERDAIISIIQDDPNAFWQRVADEYANRPDGRTRVLRDMITEYRGQDVGKAYER